MNTPASALFIMKYNIILISTEGNAVDFGDLSIGRWQIMNGTTSNAHGGL